MPKSMTFEGKTSTEAIEKGLKELNTTRDKVEIKILEEDKRSFFSILAPRIVKVEMTLKENKEKEKIHIKRERKIIDEEERKEAEEKINSFLSEFITKLPYNQIKYNVKSENEYIEVEINGEDAGHLIGYRGETLNSIQVILNAVLRNKMKTEMRVTLDICEYKKERQKTLEQLADRVAQNVIKTGKKVVLDPMRPYERKIIHSRLQDNTKIKTYSIGEEPYRKIVISINK